MNDTPTPRTDACAKSIDQSNFADSWKDDFDEFAWVPADFARILECELIAAREELKAITEQLDEWGTISKEDGHWSSHKRRERWIKTVPLNISAELETELTAVTEQRDRLAEALNKMSTAAFALNDARIDRDLLKHVTALKDLMFAAVKADEALQSLNQNAEVSHRDRERQPAADQPSEQP